MRILSPYTLLAAAVLLNSGPALGQPVRTLDDATTWSEHSGSHQNTEVRSSTPYGGNFDLLGDGALLLQKKDSTGSFVHQEAFRSSGRWTSTWMPTRDGQHLELSADVYIYGQPQDMKTGWTKFSGNPLVAPENWKHTSPQTLATPDTLWPQDQALVRGKGPYKDKWLLFFNVGAWAVGGWAAAVADSLAPLKRGENPFRLLKPYPLFDDNTRNDTLGYHAPNDWISVDDTWYTPDESRDLVSRMWTADTGPDSSALTRWSNQGRIDGIRGHDPGMAYDGKRFYLFTEDGEQLQYLSASDPLGSWTAHGVALDVGDHTGDADLSYFNNAWHLFFDDAPHGDYLLGYARTAPSTFPKGWALMNDIYGPRLPDQGQAWDEPTPDGNSFGTGDADIAVEGRTLYLTHERPVGLAYKELDLSEDQEQTVRAYLQIDRDGDGTPDAQTEAKRLVAPGSERSWTLPSDGRARVVIEMETRNSTESPYLPRLQLMHS